MKAARVLVVDDERPLVEVLVRFLEQKGQRATGVGTAEAAAAALSSGAYDLVLMDNVLPGATGMQSLPRLRALTKAPIYVMSGYTDDDTRKDALLLGATGFLPKPLEVSELLAILAALPEPA